MKWKAKLVTMEFRLGDYKAVLLNTLQYFNEQAGQIWIRTTVDETPIPTWSGASRATFQSLAHQLGTSVPIGPLEAESRVGLGKASSNGKVIIKKSEFYAGFQYQTRLPHLVFNEYNHATKGSYPRPFSNYVRYTPYGFQSRAADKWKAYAKTVKLPNPWKYLKAVPI